MHCHVKIKHLRHERTVHTEDPGVLTTFGSNSATGRGRRRSCPCPSVPAPCARDRAPAALRQLPPRHLPPLACGAAAAPDAALALGPPATCRLRPRRPPPSPTPPPPAGGEAIDDDDDGAAQAPLPVGPERGAAEAVTNARTAMRRGRDVRVRTSQSVIKSVRVKGVAPACIPATAASAVSGTAPSFDTACSQD